MPAPDYDLFDAHRNPNYLTTDEPFIDVLHFDNALLAVEWETTNG